MTATPATAFGRRLRKLREEKGLTATQLAQQVGVTRAIVSAWELKRVMPLEQSLQQIARALDVHPAYLARGRKFRDPLATQAAQRVLATARREVANLLGLDESQFSLEPRLVELPERGLAGLDAVSIAGPGSRRRVGHKRGPDWRSRSIRTKNITVASADDAGAIRIEVDRGARALRVGGVTLELSPSEFIIVDSLARAGRAGVGKAEMLQAVYGSSLPDQRHELSLPAHISRPRSALRRVTGRTDLIRRKRLGGWVIGNSEDDIYPDAAPVRWAALERSAKQCCEDARLGAERRAGTCGRAASGSVAEWRRRGGGCFARWRGGRHEAGGGCR